MNKLSGLCTATVGTVLAFAIGACVAGATPEHDRTLTERLGDEGGADAGDEDASHYYCASFTLVTEGTCATNEFGQQYCDTDQGLETRECNVGDSWSEVYWGYSYCAGSRNTCVGRNDGDLCDCVSGAAGQTGSTPLMCSGTDCVAAQ